MPTTESLSAYVLDDLDWWTRPVAERDALFAWLRARNPRPFAPELDLRGTPRGGGFWALTKLDDIREVSRRPDDFCSGKGINIFDQPPGQGLPGVVHRHGQPRARPAPPDRVPRLRGEDARGDAH